MNIKKTAISFLLLSLVAVSQPTAAFLFSDNFNSLNTTVWGCEYACPAIADGYARCNLDPGAVNTNATWSKLSYKNKTFGYGIYSMTFRYSRRPLEAETWAGWALYTETGGLVNEINFGIETACKSRCTDQTLILESYKNSNNSEVVVPVGVSLFDGTWHTVEVTYTAFRIALKFDGREVGTITDTNTIPAVTMSLIPGARVVSGTLASRFYMDIDSISISDSIYTATTVGRSKHSVMANFGSCNYPTEFFTLTGKKVDAAAFKRSGVYFLKTKLGGNADTRKMVNIR